MKVLGSNIIIRPEKKSKSSVILTDAPEEYTGYADVLYVGIEVSEVKVEDRIFYNKMAGRFIALDDEELMMITEHDVFIITGE